MQFHVLDTDTVHLPECLVGIGNLYIFQCQVLHLTEKLRSVDT